MKARTIKKDKVNIITMGCSKNLVDSEVLLSQLKGNGIDARHESNARDNNIVIINTCGFIDNAKQESVNTILEYAAAKDKGLVDKVYVTGCLSQRYKDDLELEIPQVDAFFGTRDLPALLKKFKADYKHELVGERLLSHSAHYAYMKISEGCDRPCSFCAIPLMRGGHVSRPIEELVKEARHKAAQGTKELLLIAQDSTYYGLDLYKKRRLADLLNALADVAGIEWIRLHYAYPTGFPMDVLDVMAARENICNYLDIPLQHGSTEVLKTMRRGTSREKQEELIQTIRAKIPDIAIRTTLIAGHPGEGEKEFEEMVDFVQRMRFERLGVFTYSHEEDTHAHTLEDHVPAALKQERANRIMEVQEQISFELNQQKVGKTFKVLIDKKESGHFVGRTAYDSVEVDNEVLIDAGKFYCPVGDFVSVKITGATEFDLYGDVV
ncbi:30S ribosomal protein S12 methylthiotransferase RimO [Cyclobacterium sp. SYSU L10401]|uniref:30S ribosomal protein S12 methylthiotransferase RimO n=1 Tax=Cyclobacterium sp. SYSU L10401 TaxID=2678657 RepID=UPI0013D586FC|nr:30S ribosomal protein S12 methylthiotransferase RimO [Cyclobacterium sp. SYSU L10401]